MIKATDIVVGYPTGRRGTRSTSVSLRFASYPGKCSPEVDLSRAARVAGPLSFSFGDGECVMLRGRNGSGKTTLMKTIAGQLLPLSGTIETGGEAILVPTRIPKVKGFTVEDFIRSGMLAESGAFKRLDREAERRVAEAIRMMELNQLADKDLSQISDGEFQKACIATALTRKANVLMLDEPTAFLDVENRVMVLKTLQRLAHETRSTVVFSTHDIHDGALYSDSVLAL
ncbi:MAG: ABC transporter ATP-binding protein [Bacteroidales bacterium]|nr:ABC transporter ATP-binding protein [Bacteroidales bacterium]